MHIKVAVIQATPVFFDIRKTLDKLETLVIESAQKGCQFILFPESFIPGYPRTIYVWGIRWFAYRCRARTSTKRTGKIACNCQALS